MNFRYLLAAGIVTASAPGAAVLAQDGSTAVLAAAAPAAQSTDTVLEEVRVTSARRREEVLQEVPIPISIIDGELLENAGAFNPHRLQNIVPSLQFYSTNPRNTFVNIRGLGLPFGLTNDGIESGVGFYVDGVLYARPASATLDFIDVERVEVLRGPQGTLFGKNTTAGAILVTTRKPSFVPEVRAELSYGNDNYAQGKVSVTGPLGERVAGRLSLTSTQREGNLYHTVQNQQINDLNSTSVRGQLLIKPTDSTDITLSADYSHQKPVGIAQVLAGVAPTWRASPGYGSALYDIAPSANPNPARHFWQIIDDFNYVPPNVDRATQEVRPFDRVLDTDTPWTAGNQMGGVSFNLDSQVGAGTLTATAAWRNWIWKPSNDRDGLALPVGTLSQAPSKHDQWTAEVRWAGDLSPTLSGVFGVYAFDQKLRSDRVHTESVGAAYARFRHPNLVAQWGPQGTVYPDYFAGQRSEITAHLDTVSAAVFGQLDWAITDRLSLLPGVRFNYDDKKIYFRRDTFGVPDPADLSAPPPSADDHPYGLFGTVQEARRSDDDTNVSGQLTLAFKANDVVNYYATYATAFKSIGVNLGNNQTPIPAEDVRHIELGLKSSPTPRTTANLTLFNTDTKDFQTQVLVPGSSRPVIASAEKVRVRGIEFDGSARIGRSLSLYSALAYTDGKYISFANAPVPLELTGYTDSDGQPQVDASGGRLAGVSKWSGSVGAEHNAPANFLGSTGELFTGFDLFYRDDFSSSATPSEFLNIDGYATLNLRAGYRSDSGWSAHFWVRNALNKKYFEQLQAAPFGQGAGHYTGVLGEPRYYGLTVRVGF